ncbi:MAG: S8 family serine peptidase [Candidatus Nanoarchaeia archaeon]|nr:S8 family serine peptidase [Candidatus Nanoarchaeia archaeon]
MGKTAIAVVIILLFSVSLVMALSSNSKIDVRINTFENIEKEISSKGNARVIITTNNAKQIGMASVGLGYKKNNIKKIGEKTYVLDVDNKKLEELKQDKNIYSFELDQEIHAFLSESVPLVRSDIVNSLVYNENITGKNVGICILDTGIDKTHEAFQDRVVNEKCFCNGCCQGFDISDDATDDNGHGTHVAGIAAANSNIVRGVAPEANIIAVKILDNKGDGDLSDAILGINYCIKNKDLFNINIISMSFGGGSYPNYCDGDFPSYRDAINLAVANNITVVAASGNSANLTSIAAPACIENVTSVGAIYDANFGLVPWGVCTDSETSVDKIACFTNRNNLLDLLAPGTAIYSTWLSNSYSTGHGTSQAVPHVSGAIALLQQYKKEESNSTLTPLEIETILKQTGKQIYDSSTNLTFSRIDVYEALESIDEKAPSIYDFKIQENIKNNENITFDFNASDIFLNSKYLEINSQIYPIDYILDTSQFSISDTVTYRYYANDTNNNTNSSDLFSFKIQGYPIINIISPSNNSYLLNGTNEFSYYATDDDLANCTLSVNNQEFFNQTTNGTIMNQTINLQEDGSYTVYCYDALSNYNEEINFFTVDLTNEPEVENINFVSSLSYNQPQNITVTLKDYDPISEVFIDINGNQTMTYINPYYEYSFIPPACGNINFIIYFKDALNYLGKYENSFTVSCCGNSVCDNSETCSSCSSDCGACSSSSSGGSGGGGGGGGGHSSSSVTTNSVSSANETIVQKQSLSQDEKNNETLESEKQQEETNEVSGSTTGLAVKAPPKILFNWKNIVAGLVLLCLLFAGIKDLHIFHKRKK